MPRWILGLGLLAMTALPAFADGNVKSLKDFEYWDGGQIRQCTVYNAQTGKLRGKIFCAPDGGIKRIEKFDENGNKVEEALYDGAGHLKAGVDGWAARRAQYNGSQMMIQISYDEFGKALEQKMYSESGRLITRLYRDDDTQNPYVNAAMYMMLGSRNIGFYDSKATYDESIDMLREE